MRIISQWIGVVTGGAFVLVLAIVVLFFGHARYEMTWDDTETCAFDEAAWKRNAVELFHAPVRWRMLHAEGSMSNFLMPHYDYLRYLELRLDAAGRVYEVVSP